MEMMEFHPKDYRQWLSTKKPKEIIGITCASCACPIANWLHETLKHKVIVDNDRITLCVAGEKPNKSYRAPQWVVKHIRAVDVRGFREEVTAERALALLGTAAGE
jgi:predicted metal-binding protein